MRWIVSVAAALLAVPVSFSAADLERALKSRWQGAWVVVNVEIYSDCAGSHTNNRVRGKLVSSRGRVRFRAGELAKVEKIDAKRSRLDLHLHLAEPVLLPYNDGPFTLFREVYCQVELMVEVPRDLVHGRDVDGIERVLASILQGYATSEEARRTEAWNRRERDPYPPDYQETLAEHAAWRVERHNAIVQARIDQAHEVIYALTDRLSGDPDYLAGFAEGVEEARSAELGDCSQLLDLDLRKSRRRGSGFHGGRGDHRTLWDRGFLDGRNLVLGLEMIRLLPGCFLSPPSP